MEFQIDRGQLIKHLAHVEGVVESRKTLPILSNLLIEAKDGMLTLLTSDLDITARKQVPQANITTPGRITIQMSLLSNIIRKTPEGSQIHFKLDENNGRMMIVAGRSRFAIATLSADDFPLPSFESSDSVLNIQTQAIETALKRVKAAMSTEETRYYLNGCYFVIEDGNMLAVATDGHRLSVSQIEVDNIPSTITPVIVPRKAVAEILKLTASVEGEASIELNQRAMRFTLGDVQLQCKLIDGTFPEFRRVIPQDHEITVKFEAGQLSTAIDRVSAVSAERTRQVVLDISQDAIKISVTDPDMGVATDEVSVESTGSLKIAFNSRYLIEILNGYGGELVEMQLNTETLPAKIISANRPNDVHILMPMRC